MRKFWRDRRDIKNNLVIGRLPQQRSHMIVELSAVFLMRMAEVFIFVVEESLRRGSIEAVIESLNF